MEKYISIGCKCQTAMALRRLNLRSDRMPFDYVASNLNGVISCLETKHERNPDTVDEAESQLDDFCRVPNEKHPYNRYGFWMGHYGYNTEEEYEIIKNKTQVKFDQLFTTLDNTECTLNIIYATTDMKNKFPDFSPEKPMSGIQIAEYTSIMCGRMHDIYRFINCIERRFKTRKYVVHVIDNFTLNVSIDSRYKVRMHSLGLTRGDVDDDQYLAILMGKISSIFIKGQVDLPLPDGGQKYMVFPTQGDD